MNEAYYTKYNTGGYKKSGPSKRYLNFSVSRKNVQSTDANGTQSNATLLEISFMNLDKNDFSTIKQNCIPSARFWMQDNMYHTPCMTFSIPEAKFAKWVRLMMPKIKTILEASTTSQYPNIDNLESDLMDAIHNSVNPQVIERAQVSLKALEEAIYNAIQNNKWDEAMVLYKKAINLIARVYGHQLAPNNVKAIYAQAEAAGIKPTDKGAATDSYWPDGTEKFWPTFVRSASTWRKWGRTIKDEPKMQYYISSSYTKRETKKGLQQKASAMGLNASDLSLQQNDTLGVNKTLAGLRGAAYDISDTEGTTNFFDELGLLNNLDGTLTDKAKIDSEQWMQKMQDIKNQQNVQLNAQDQKKQDLTSEEGQAKIFYNALVDLCSRSKMEKGWDNLGIKLPQQIQGDPIITYLNAVYNIAKAKINMVWKNPTNTEKIAQMVTAAVALCTVGKSKLPQMGYDFSNVSHVFGSYEECKSTVLGVSDSIISALSYETDKQFQNDTPLNEIKFLIKFGSLMERMNNLRTEGYKYELNEGMIRRPSDDAIMSFLGQFGLNFNEENPSENNPNNNME